MGIATREGMITAHKLAIKQLEGMQPSSYVEGTVHFAFYQEALQVQEVMVEYMARGQRTASRVSIRVGRVTEAPTNKGGRELNLPYTTGHEDLAPEIILVTEERGQHRAWIKLQGKEEWKICLGSADSWFFG